MIFYGDPKKALKAMSQGKMVYALIPIDAHSKIGLMVEAFGYFEGDLEKEYKEEKRKNAGD